MSSSIVFNYRFLHFQLFILLSADSRRKNKSRPRNVRGVGTRRGLKGGIHRAWIHRCVSRWSTLRKLESIGRSLTKSLLRQDRIPPLTGPLAASGSAARSHRWIRRSDKPPSIFMIPIRIGLHRLYRLLRNVYVGQCAYPMQNKSRTHQLPCSLIQYSTRTWRKVDREISIIKYE